MSTFIDRATIHVSGGKGGDGMVTFHREKFLPKGGPSGGDGGNGANVVIKADPALNTLISFRYRRVFKGDRGGSGGSSKKHGRNGQDVLVPVPVGTRLFEASADGSETMVADLSAPDQMVVVARGGRGGFGNAHFVGPTNQEPLLAEAGEEGEDRDLRLELLLLADLGIIGLPNAGKSSLIAAISAARPRIANYPFTTLEPVLGVVEWQRRALVAVDIPGLIEGAHEGAGLGHDFLRHIDRTRVLVHLVDGSDSDVAESVETIRQELALFDQSLVRKPRLIVVNKVDLPEVAANRSQIAAKLQRFFRPEVPVAPAAHERAIFISAATHEGLDTLVPLMFEMVGRAKSAGAGREVAQQGGRVPDWPGDDEGLPVLHPRPVDEGGGVEREGDAFRITHRRAVRLANGSDLSLWKARMQFQEQLRRMGVMKELDRLGVASGSIVHVGTRELVWDEA